MPYAIFKQITIASTNRSKIDEINQLFKKLLPFSVEVESIQNYAVREPDEPYTTFLENARHKAGYYATVTGKPTLSEDSGLCIEGLGNFPGVRSKEFLASFIELGGDKVAFNMLEKMLKDIKHKNAYFHCTYALYLPQKKHFINYEGQVRGHLTFPPKGSYGFAYDSIFVPEGYTKTFAEMSIEEKTNISHRNRALKGLIEEIIKYDKSI